MGTAFTKEMTAAELEKLLARLELDTDCDCDNEDCARCAHYPTFVEQAQKKLRDMAPTLARKAIAAEKLAEAAKALKERCASGEFFSDYDGDWKLVGDVSSALAAWEAAK